MLAVHFLRVLTLVSDDVFAFWSLELGVFLFVSVLVSTGLCVSALVFPLLASLLLIGIGETGKMIFMNQKSVAIYGQTWQSRMYFKHF